MKGRNSYTSELRPVPHPFRCARFFSRLLAHRGHAAILSNLTTAGASLDAQEAEKHTGKEDTRSVRSTLVLFTVVPAQRVDFSRAHHQSSCLQGDVHHRSPLLSNGSDQCHDR